MRKVILTKDGIHQGNLILVNKNVAIKHKISHKELRQYNEKYQNILLAKEPLAKLQEMLIDIKAGKDIVPVSGYRSLEEQTNIYLNSLKENGIAFTKQFVAFPNCSEHQSGLAIDLALNVESIDFICPLFPEEGICKKFKQQAKNYGFIQRYKTEKENITQISCEPWHFRYVGIPHAAIMEKFDFCLEEYLEFLKNYTYPNKPLFYKNYEISYLYLQQEEKEILLEENDKISGNNIDGFIITRKIQNERNN